MDPEILEFEPGAAPLFFCDGRDENGDPVIPVAMRISVSLEDACLFVNGVWDGTKQGFNFDLNPLGPDLEPRKYNAYAYAYFSDAPTKPIRVGYFKLKPIVGCEWRP